MRFNNFINSSHFSSFFSVFILNQQQILCDSIYISKGNRIYFKMTDVAIELGHSDKLFLFDVKTLTQSKKKFSKIPYIPIALYIMYPKLEA